MTAGNHLFSEFKKVSSKAWKQKIQVDLKGEDYQKLITRTLEKIDIKPFYHYDDYRPFEQYAPQHFQIVQELKINNEKVAHAIISKALIKGGQKFSLNFDKTFDIDTLIQNIPVQQLIFKADMLDTDFIKKLYQKTGGKSPILLDPIGHFARFGNWYENETKDFEKLRELQRFFPQNFFFLEIRANLYKNAGAHITQELAYALSHAIEYLEKLGANTTFQIIFNFAAGSHYFFEIAKLKALRTLWQLIQNEYNTHAKTYIFAQPTLRNKTIFDPYVNMLRTTMEMMSSILGGADWVANMPYDYIFNKSNEFSERIARNQLIILKEEAGFEKALQASLGNYYLEETTRHIASKVLEIFKQIEAANGFINQLYKGKIQQKITESAQKEQKDFDNGKIILVGTNKYINKNEKPEAINRYPFVKKRKGQTLVPPIVPKRLAEKTEMERLKSLGIRL